MKYLQTYSQLNESNGYDILTNLLNKFSKKIDAKKLTSLILPNKNLLMPYYNKYVKNGVINADDIYRDFKRLNFTANEGHYDYDYADNYKSNPILRFLYKLFVRWPKNIITGIWELFYDTVIETWHDSKLAGIVASILWLVVGIFVYLLGYFIYSGIEHEINGLENGKVSKESFEPGHYEARVHTINTGKETITYTSNDWVPDTWYVEVVGEDNRREVWYTYNHKVGDSVEVGDEITNDDNWTWRETK